MTFIYKCDQSVNFKRKVRKHRQYGDVYEILRYVKNFKFQLLTILLTMLRLYMIV